MRLLMGRSQESEDEDLFHPVELTGACAWVAWEGGGATKTLRER